MTIKVPISLQRCADASPREARVLGKLERANKQVKLISRAGKSKSKVVSDSSSSAEPSSDDEGTKRSTNRSRQIKLNPKLIEKKASKTGKRIASSDSEDETKSSPIKRRSTKIRRQQTKHDDNDQDNTPQENLKASKNQVCFWPETKSVYKLNVHRVCPYLSPRCSLG
jgi:hypothetical protein